MGRIRSASAAHLLIVIAVTCLPVTTEAWDHLGHMVVARIAYEGLSEQERAAAFEILKEHPHYELYLTVGAPADPQAQREYVFVKAATWPDAVRPPLPGRPPLIKDPLGDQKNVTKYHHAPWHYLNRMYVLPTDAADAGSDGKDANVDKGDVLTNLKASVADLKGGPGPAAQRAIDLCWVLHLCGDVHQPLHCATLISTDFPPGEGDRGGNSVNIHRPPHSKIKATELHAYWDGLLGSVEMDKFDATGLGDVDTLAAALISEQPKNALPGLGDAAVEDWVKESYALAKEKVYKNGEIFPAQWDKSQPVELAPEYEKEAIATAKVRVALAGYRLTDLLRTALAP